MRGFGLENLDHEWLEPNMISTAYPKAVVLDRDRVVSVVYEGPTLRKFHARFEFVGGPQFGCGGLDRFEDKRFFPVLRDLCPGVVTDNRKPR